tara:strand:- start:493 stop:720 length:228 start_codon:yes stop_codon:yes gene_type:complete
MKSKNILDNIKDYSIDQAKKEITEIVELLEKEENLNNYLNEYQRLIHLNKLVEEKFKTKLRDLSLKKKNLSNKSS